MITLEKLVIDDEFRDLLDPLTSDEFKTLAASIRADGWLHPIVVWQHHNILLDGHNRYDVWREEGGDGPDIIEKKFATREEAKDWVIDLQRGRRNLSSDRLAYLIGKKYENRKQTEGAPKDNKNAAKNNSAKVAELNQATAARVAKETGVSPRTVENDAKFSAAVDKLDKAGVLPKANALGGKAKSGVTRAKVIEAAKQETPEAAKAVLEGKAPAKPPKPEPTPKAKATAYLKAAEKSLGALQDNFANAKRFGAKFMPVDAHCKGIYEAIQRGRASL